MDLSETKECFDCKRVLDRDCFRKNRKAKDGLQHVCKDCMKKRDARHRTMNAERIKSSSKAYRQRNDDKIRAKRAENSEANSIYKKEYAKKNAEKIKAYKSQYYAENSDFVKAQCKKRYERDKEAILKKQKEYYEQNADIIKKRARQYREEHAEERKAAWIEYRKNNPEKVRIIGERYRSRRSNLIADFNFVDWTLCQFVFECRCAYCGQRSNDLEQEHVVPVSKGGHYVPSNIVPACRICNASKCAEDMNVWYRRQSFFRQNRLDFIERYLEEYARKMAQ